jgi:hypothetical protein
MLEYWSNGDLLVFYFHYSSSGVGAAHPAAYFLPCPFEKAGGIHFAAQGVMAV